MQIESINAVNSIQDVTKPHMTQGPQADFDTWLSGNISSLDNKIQSADTALQELATNKFESMHTVMIAMEEAKLSMQFAVEVRNKLVESYHEIMRMQM